MPSLKKLVNKNIVIPTIPLNKCIGKTVEGLPGMLTYEHCLIVGYVAQVFRRVLPSYQRQRLPRMIAALAALHDLGKVSPGFVMKIYKYLKPSLSDISPKLAALPLEMFETKHAAISEASFLARYASKETCAVYGSILGAHHGSRGCTIFQDTCDKYGEPKWAMLRRELGDKIVKTLGEPYLTKLNPLDAEIISGFISLCDWIASDEHFFSPAGKIKDIHGDALRAIRSLGWKKTIIRQGLSFQDLFGFDPRPEQKAFIDSVTKPGVYVLESRTGSGKTEPALAAAYNLIASGQHSGIYFALPTRVTSERLLKRFSKFIENAFEKGMAPHLIHGQSILCDEKYLGCGELAPGGMWFSSNRRALMLPFGIGTIDQILMSVVHAKYNFIRTFGIANKVIIIDELHSYDAYTGKLTDLLIKKLRELNCTVIVLSATLTQERKKQLLGEYTSADVRYPLITTKTKDRVYTRSAGKGTSRNVRVRKMLVNFPRLFNEVERRVLAGQQVLWILNTVDRATAVYKEMKSRPFVGGLTNARVGLIHSRFPAKDRSELEETWMERLGNGVKSDRSVGSLLISTQVLEQSVDVDADFLITDIAPSDFIIQRMGRLWRHDGRKRPCAEAEVWIICPNLSGIKSLIELRRALGVHARIYSDYVLWRSYRTWVRRGTISDPEDLRDILESTYRDSVSQDPTWLKEAWTDMLGKKMAMRDLAKASTGEHVLLFDDEENDYTPVDVLPDAEDNTATRLLSIPTKQLILLSSLKESKDTVDLGFIDGESITITKGKRFLKAIKAITFRMVKVPLNKILKEAVSPEWLEDFVFGGPIPVTVDANNMVRLLDGTLTGYFYEKDCGFYKPIALF